MASILDLLDSSQLKATRPSKERVKAYGNRPDGTPKGAGYFGEIANPRLGSGNFSTELTVGVEIDGKPMDIPAIVPTLTKRELNIVMSEKDVKKWPDSIFDKAVAHAKKRMREKKSPYAGDGEFYPLPQE